MGSDRPNHVNVDPVLSSLVTMTQQVEQEGVSTLFCRSTFQHSLVLFKTKQSYISLSFKEKGGGVSSENFEQATVFHSERYKEKQSH